MFPSFHPSLGIPLIITPVEVSSPALGKICFHPSLGIPLIITLGRVGATRCL
jgi:hypothetical protein